MNNILIVVPCCMDDGPTAERMLDWVYQCSGKEAYGHVLLSFAHDIHAEYRMKLRISAELAFESVTEFQATKKWLPNNLPDRGEPKTKTEFINNLWEQTANHIAHHYRWPWLWVEPDCVPLTPDWRVKLADAYANQPKKFFGSHMKRKVGDAEHLFLARTAIYHAGAFNELNKFSGGAPPFEWASEAYVIPRSTKSRLFQQLAYEGDPSKVRPDAVLLHSDKTGKLIEHLREKIKQVEEGKVTTEYNPFADCSMQNGEKVEVRNIDETIHGKGVDMFASQSKAFSESFEEAIHGRKVVPIPTFLPIVGEDAPMPEDNALHDPEPKCDKRKKEYREWKARQEAKAT